MNSTYKTFGLFIVLAFALFACNHTTTKAYHEQAENSATHKTPGMHKAVVEEVMHPSIYTYLLMNENDSKAWIANQ